MLKDIRSSATSKKGMEILTWTAIAVIIVVIAIVLTKVFKAFKLGAQTAGDISGGVIIQQQTGISVERQAVCKSVANGCESAITRLPLVGTVIWVTDDDVVNSLNRLLTNKEAMLASNFFKELTGDSLKSIVEGGFMVDASRAKISSVVRQNLI